MMSKMVRCTVSSKLSRLRMLAASVKYALPSKNTQCGKSFARYYSDRNVELEHFDLLPIQNEQLLHYTSGSDERVLIKSALTEIINNIEPVPIVIAGQEIYDKCDRVQMLPYNINHYIARYNHAAPELIQAGIDKAVQAQVAWDTVKLSERMAIWERAARLIATKYRFKIVAAIIVGQGKTLCQAEMDVAELIDIIRINPVFLRDLANYEPINDRPTACRNHMILRGLKGFVAAISPFNYTSIAGNLAYTPALMGNAVLWKPADSAILSSWYVFQAMREAGLPDGVVNFVPAEPQDFARMITNSPNLAGINFTGTANVLKELWQKVAQKIHVYDNYPRLVGDSGGKNFHFVHSSADPDVAVACTIRAAFEYAGQKCSSCSMLYVPRSLWETEIRNPLLNITRKLFIGEATYCDCFFSAVIDNKAYDRIFQYLKYIHHNPECEVLLGGTCRKSTGYFIDPTIVLVKDLDDDICKEELLGPILCVYVYEDRNVFKLMNKVTQINHGLTGSVFASDSDFIKEACHVFKSNVGNLNINDKCTGSKVGQQPFGAGQLTGTTDKLGSPQYLLRWTSPQLIKESFVPHVNVYYPYMGIDTNELTQTSSDHDYQTDYNTTK